MVAAIHVLESHLNGRRRDSKFIIQEYHVNVLPIKSGIVLPSENLPVGCLKNVSPYGQKFARPTALFR